MSEQNSALLNSVCQMIRSELKLPEKAELRPETPLVGGEHDLDSLDILMLVTATEKTFKISIEDESIGRDVFTNIGTLTQFIAQKQAESTGASTRGAQ